MRIAFVGLGEMGRRMCLRLIRAGHTVSVYNRDQSKTASIEAEGAQVANSVTCACLGADIAISMLRDDKASQAVWNQETLIELSQSASGLTIVEMSTLSKDWTLKLSQAVKGVGLNFIAAPVIGSLLPAENGKLIILAAGDRAKETEIKVVLQSLGEQVHWYDKVESASIIKLAVNFFFSAQVKAAVDAMKVILGQDPELKKFAFDVFRTLPITSSPIAGILTLIEKEQFSPSFPINLVYKDLKYFEELSQQMEAATQVTSVFAMGINAGLGEENIHSIWKL